MENAERDPVENAGTTARRARPFEVFRVGERVRSAVVRVDAERIRRFAEIAGDYNPIHMDPEFAATTIHRGVIAHGLLVASIATGMAYGAGLLGENVLALERSAERYLAAVRPGDEVYGLLEIAETDPEASRKYGRVVWKAELFRKANGRPDVAVMQAEWTTLIFKEAFLPDPA